MLLAAAALLVSCGKDDKDEIPSGTSYFMGKMEVVFMGTTFPTENVVVSFDYDKDRKQADILFNQVKFVPQMPVTIDIVIPAVPVTASGDILSFKGDGIVPTTGGIPYEQYTVSELAGSLSGDVLELSLKFGSFPTSFRGTRVE